MLRTIACWRSLRAPCHSRPGASKAALRRSDERAPRATRFGSWHRSLATTDKQGAFTIAVVTSAATVSSSVTTGDLTW